MYNGNIILKCSTKIIKLDLLLPDIPFISINFCLYPATVKAFQTVINHTNRALYAKCNARIIEE